MHYVLARVVTERRLTDLERELYHGMAGIVRVIGEIAKFDAQGHAEAIRNAESTLALAANRLGKNEAAALMAGNPAIQEPALVAAWKMNDRGLLEIKRASDAHSCSDPQCRHMRVMRPS